MELTIEDAEVPGRMWRVCRERNGYVRETRLRVGGGSESTATVEGRRDRDLQGLKLDPHHVLLVRMQDHSVPILKGDRAVGLRSWSSVAQIVRAFPSESAWRSAGMWSRHHVPLLGCVPARFRAEIRALGYGCEEEQRVGGGARSRPLTAARREADWTLLTERESRMRSNVDAGSELARVRARDHGVRSGGGAPSQPCRLAAERGCAGGAGPGSGSGRRCELVFRVGCADQLATTPWPSVHQAMGRRAAGGAWQHSQTNGTMWRRELRSRAPPTEHELAGGRVAYDAASGLIADR